MLTFIPVLIGVKVNVDHLAQKKLLAFYKKIRTVNICQKNDFEFVFYLKVKIK